MKAVKALLFLIKQVCHPFCFVWQNQEIKNQRQPICFRFSTNCGTANLRSV